MWWSINAVASSPPPAAFEDRSNGEATGTGGSRRLRGARARGRNRCAHGELEQPRALLDVDVIVALRLPPIQLSILLSTSKTFSSSVGAESDGSSNALILPMCSIISAANLREEIGDIHPSSPETADAWAVRRQGCATCLQHRGSRAHWSTFNAATGGGE